MKQSLFLLIACTAVLTANALAADVTIGFIYVGPKDDYGYNQAHALGAASVAKLPGVKIVEEANVPETVAVQETMRDMIVQDNATVLFPTSFGYYDPHILKVAKQFPKIQFLHCGGFYIPGKHPANVGTYFGYIDEAERRRAISWDLSQQSRSLKYLGILTASLWARGA
jgi:basic membrane protein A